MTEMVLRDDSGAVVHPGISLKTRQFFAEVLTNGGHYSDAARTVWPSLANPSRKAAKLLKLYPGYLRAAIVPHTEKLIPRALQVVERAMDDEGTSLKDRADVAFKFVAMADKFHQAAQGGGAKDKRPGQLTVEELAAKALEIMSPEKARALMDGIATAALWERLLGQGTKQVEHVESGDEQVQLPDE